MAEESKEKLYERAKAYVDTLYTEWKPRHTAYLSKVKRWRKLYENENVSKTYHGQADYNDPETFKQVESWTPRITDTLVHSVVPFFKVKGRDNELDRKQAIRIESLVQYNNDKANFEHYFEKSTHRMIVDGIQIVKTPWSMDMTYGVESKIKVTTEVLSPMEAYTNAPKLLGIPLGGIPMTKEKREIVQEEYIRPFDAPKYVPVAVDNWVTDDNVDEWDNQIGCIELVEFTWEELKALEKNDRYGTYVNLKLVEEKLYKDKKLTEIPKNMKLKAKEFWGKFDINADGISEQCTIILLDELNIVVRCDENPYNFKQPPYMVCKFIPVEGHFWPKGLPAIFEKLQIGLNATRNQLQDTVTFQLYNMTLADERTGLNQDKMKIRPMGLIKVNPGTIEGVQFLKPVVDLATVLSNIRMLKDDITTAGGATVPIQGVQTQKGTTASEVVSLVAEANKRFRRILSRVSNEIISVWIRRCYQMDMQFMDRKWAFRVIGEEAKGLQWYTREEIYADVDLIPTGVTSMENELIARREALDVLQVLSQMPIVRGKGGEKMLNTEALVDDLLQTYKKKDIEKYYIPVPEEVKEQAQMAQAEQTGAEAPKKAPPNNIPDFLQRLTARFKGGR